MRRALGELTVAGLMIVGLTAIFATIAEGASTPGDPALHGAGIAGILLMLWAEVGHSLRRRSHGPAWVPARASLSAHVVAGLVGPALVLLHTNWQFRGLAGVVTVMTLLVVASGVTGRFVYPTVDAMSPTGVRRVVAGWHLIHVPLATATLALAIVHAAAAMYFGAGLR